MKKKVKVTENVLNEVCQEVIQIVLSKNNDYGDAWQKQGIAGVMVRLSDKLCRVESLSDGREVLIADEKLQDTLIDAIGYSILGLLYLNNDGIKSDSKSN